MLILPFWYVDNMLIHFPHPPPLPVCLSLCFSLSCSLFLPLSLSLSVCLSLSLCTYAQYFMATNSVRESKPSAWPLAPWGKVLIPEAPSMLWALHLLMLEKKSRLKEESWYSKSQIVSTMTWKICTYVCVCVWGGGGGGKILVFQVTDNKLYKILYLCLGGGGWIQGVNANSLLHILTEVPFCLCFIYFIILPVFVIAV